MFEVPGEPVSTLPFGKRIEPDRIAERIRELIVHHNTSPSLAITEKIPSGGAQTTRELDSPAMSVENGTNSAAVHEIPLGLIEYAVEFITLLMFCLETAQNRPSWGDQPILVQAPWVPRLPFGIVP